MHPLADPQQFLDIHGNQNKHTTRGPFDTMIHSTTDIHFPTQGMSSEDVLITPQGNGYAQPAPAADLQTPRAVGIIQPAYTNDFGPLLAKFGGQTIGLEPGPWPEESNPTTAYSQPGYELSFQEMFDAHDQADAAQQSDGLAPPEEIIPPPEDNPGLAEFLHELYPSDNNFEANASSDADDEFSPAQAAFSHDLNNRFRPALNGSWRSPKGSGLEHRQSLQSSQGSLGSLDPSAFAAQYSSFDSSMESVPSGASGASSDGWNQPDGDLPTFSRMPRPPTSPNLINRANGGPGIPSGSFLAASLAKNISASDRIDNTPRLGGGFAGPRPLTWSRQLGGGSASGYHASLTSHLAAPTADQANQATTAVLQGPASAYLYPGGASSAAGPSSFTGQQQQAKTVADCLNALVDSVIADGPDHVIRAANGTDNRFLIELYQAVLIETNFESFIPESQATAALPRSSTPHNTPAKRRYASLDMSELGYSPTQIPAGSKEIAYKTGEFDELENHLVKRISQHYDAELGSRGLRGQLSLAQEQDKWQQIIPIIQDKLHTWRSDKQIMKAAIDLGVKTSTTSRGRRLGQEEKRKKRQGIKSRKGKERQMREQGMSSGID